VTCSELISRWLYNVEAVKEWADASRNNALPTGLAELGPSSPPLDTIQHMTSRDSQPTLFGPESPPISSPTIDASKEVQKIRWWTTRTKIPPELQIEKFIGQGRKIQYCGMPHAFLQATERVDFSTATPDELYEHAATVAGKLQGGKPLAWYVVAMLSLLLVWTAIMSAFVVSFRVCNFANIITSSWQQTLTFHNYTPTGPNHRPRLPNPELPDLRRI